MNIIIACVDKRYGIGKDNDLLVRNAVDMAHFKNTTIGHTVLMGRKTYDSIGHPFPNRTNIVCTRNNDLKIPGVILVHDIESVLLEYSQKLEKLYIAGGGKVYMETMRLGLVQKMILTHVDYDYGATTFFPDFDSGDYKIQELWASKNMKCKVYMRKLI